MKTAVYHFVHRLFTYAKMAKKSNIDWTLLILPAPNYLTSNAHQYSEQ
jgi:hypothetical protein